MSTGEAVVATLLAVSLAANLILVCKVRRGARTSEEEISQQEREADDSRGTSSGEDSEQPAGVQRSVSPDETANSGAVKRRAAWRTMLDRKVAGAPSAPGTVRSPPRSKKFSFFSLSKLTSTPAKKQQQQSKARLESRLSMMEEEDEVNEMEDLK